MKKQWLIGGLVMLLLVCVAGAGCQKSEEAELPKVLTLATMPPGMIVNAQGVGIADICTKYTPMTIKVSTATNEMAWVPMTATKEIDLGVASSLPIRQAYLGSFVFEGIAKKAKVKSFPLRLICGGAPLLVNFMVRGDDQAQTIADLKGRRVVTFREGTHFDLYNKARLANAGLSLDDVKQVPAANPIESARAVMEGRADAGDVALGAPIVTEAAAKVKARFLPLDPSSGAVRRMKKFVEVSYVAKVPGGVFPGVPEAQNLMHMDTVFVAREDISDDVVYELTKAIWEHNAELLKKPGLMAWKIEKYLTTQPGLPYHDGAIKFYKEIGVWDREMVKFQRNVLLEQP